MKKSFIHSMICCAGFVFCMGSHPVSAQNPIVRDQFSADPTARVFNGKVYVYPSHDILAVEGKGRPGWFCMADYHVFSSDNLSDWTDHGVIVSQNKVNWVDSTTYSMWAPDCIERNGKFYFYFPANKKKTDPNARAGSGVGVAIADKPEGPYVPQAEPIKNVSGIDPNVFIDKDGQAYLYWAMGKIFVAKLKENMLELASEPKVIQELPTVGLVEGPFLFERKGIYYMTYPHVQNRIERLEYAISDNPMGPFKFAGVIMDESPMNCWTNHHSFIDYKGQWYLFYHQNAYSPKFDKNRSICVDSMFFNADGTIRKVIPTHRGVGITKASQQIEIDRYSAISEAGTSIAFLDTLNTFKGWKTVLEQNNAWVQYNRVDFGKQKTVQLRACAGEGATVCIYQDKVNGKLLSEVKIPAGTSWTTVESKVSNGQTGVHNLVVVLKGDKPAEIDWIRFN
ncbi:MAG: family 43 glycosylhydrolase [Bacteroidales bacterium]|nr:family 43 glycosylhydrolase [Bacteroidales bacterium]